MSPSSLCLLLTLLILSAHTAASDELPSAALGLHAEKKTSAKTIPLAGGLLHASGFFFNATVGGQHLTLQVDISYSSLIVPKKGCTTCRIGDRRYDPAKSKTAKQISCGDSRCASKEDQCKSSRCYKCNVLGHCCAEGTENCAFNVFYGDGSTGNGTMWEDVLSIGGVSAKVVLGAMHDESHNFELPYADGVFGLAFQKGACRPACVPPVMDTVVKETGIGDVFTMCVSRFGGTLTLGAADKTLGMGEYEYVGVEESQKDNRFIIPVVDEWKVGERMVKMPGVTRAMWTAGTSYIGVSKSGFLAVLGVLTEHYCHVEGLCSMTSWFRPQKCALIPDEAVRQMPNITMGIARGLGIVLTPEDYLIKYRVVRGRQARCVGFVVADGLAQHGIGLLLGTTVMRRYAVVFDRKGGRVGIAGAVEGKCGPKEGSLEGLPGSSMGPGGPVVTGGVGDTGVGVDNRTEVGKRLLEAEKCRAERNCGGCARLKNCSFGYRSGRCVLKDEAGKQPYPYCSGGLCACFVTGEAGWYFGVGVGVLLGGGIGVVIALVYRKRRRRNAYQVVNEFEEHDLETF